jgi:hypothetical protein
MNPISPTSIDPEEVNRVFVECIASEEDSSDETLTLQVIVHTFRFHRGRLESKRPLISGWLALLPTQFQQTGGGGWSFLNACNQRDGTQWTGLHLRMEQLFAMGLALGLVKECMPRELWSVLPGEMPYYMVVSQRSVAAD